MLVKKKKPMGKRERFWDMLQQKQMEEEKPMRRYIISKSLWC
jgi:hypothetical protein